jgi:ABC-type Fe3+ transport system, permease component
MRASKWFTRILLVVAVILLAIGIVGQVMTTSLLEEAKAEKYDGYPWLSFTARQIKAGDDATFIRAITQSAQKVSLVDTSKYAFNDRIAAYAIGNSDLLVLWGGLIFIIDCIFLFLMRKSGILDIKWVIIITIVTFMAIFQTFPLLYLIFRTFVQDGKLNFESFARVYTYAGNLKALRNTLISASLSMVFGIVLAFPLAWLVGRTNLYGKKFFRTLFVMTYMVPPYVGAIAWIRLLNPTVGDINIMLMNLFRLESAPINIYSMGGLVWVLTTFYYPYAFITISRAMEKMDPSLEEASRISGASPLKTLTTITMPLMMPSILGAALLVFVAAASCYGIPSIVGAPAKLDSVTTRIIDFVSQGSAEGLNDATSLALVLMVIANVVLFFSTFVIGKKQYITVSGKSTRPNIVDLGKWRIPCTALLWIFATIAVFIPFATVALTSFSETISRPLGFGNFSLKSWEKVLTGDSYFAALGTSMITAILAATIGVIVASMMAYLLVRTRIPGRRIPDFLITLGSGTPSVVIALSLILVFSGKFPINLRNTLSILFIAYMIKYLMMGMRTIVSAFAQISSSLEEAALISGANWFRSFKDVTLPLIAPSVVAGWFLIFMPSFYELSMSTMLYGSKTKTLGYLLYEMQTYHTPQTAAVLATFILVMVIVLNAVLNKLTKGEFSI